MSVESTMAIRKEEFRRRVEALPREVQSWKDRTAKEVDMNLHFSQLNAIAVLMEALVKQQRALLDQLDLNTSAVNFGGTGLELIKVIIKSQRVWDFFRDKLDLRFSPIFRDVLWVADTVAWNCHRPVLERAANDGIILGEELREPPLTYLTAEFSPATWVRGSRPNDGRDYKLGTANLPVPVIELPWDHVENLWELLSILHEVGHDIEADLRLRPALLMSLQDRLAEAGVSSQRINIWQAWEGEIFADLVGLQLGGPAFAESLLHLLILPASMINTYDSSDPHPTHYVRILMNAAYIRTLVPGRKELDQHAKEIEDNWKALYGEQPQFDKFLKEFPVVSQALMDTKLPALKGKTVRELMPFTAADDARIRAAAKHLATGENTPAAGSIAPRHCISAARLAVKSVVSDAATFSASLAAINERTVALVRDNTPPGLRGGDDTAPHQKYIASFADHISI